MNHKRINKMYVEFAETPQVNAEGAVFDFTANYDDGRGFAIIPVANIGVLDNGAVIFTG